MKFLLVVGLLLASCTPAGSFNRQYGKALCERLESCAPGAMDLLFDDENTCQMAAKNKMSDIRKDKDCTFQPRAAEECLETLQYARCQQVLDEDGIQSCERVYRCDGEPEDGSDEDTGQ